MAGASDAGRLFDRIGLDRDLLRQQHLIPHSSYWGLEYGHWLWIYSWGFHSGNQMALI